MHTCRRANTARNTHTHIDRRIGLLPSVGTLKIVATVKIPHYLLHYYDFAMSNMIIVTVEKEPK